MIGISGSLIRTKTLMELIYNPCGEFRWSPEDPVSQIHTPHLLVGAPWIFSDILRSVQMLKREWGAESNGKLQYLFIPGKTAALVTEFAVEELPSAELQPLFLSLQWKTCLWAELKFWFLSLHLKTCLGQNCNLGSWVNGGRPPFDRTATLVLIIEVLYCKTGILWLLSKNRVRPLLRLTFHDLYVTCFL